MYDACGDGKIRRRMPEEEKNSIISHCHDLPCGGHASVSKTATKILQASFYFPTLFKDMHRDVWLVIDVKGLGICQKEIKCP